MSEQKRHVARGREVVSRWRGGGWTAWNTVHRYWQELQWWDQWLGKPAT